jgi:transposase-like protein
MIKRFMEFWCKMFHRAGFPIHSQYTCPDCRRTHAVNW